MIYALITTVIIIIFITIKTKKSLPSPLSIEYKTPIEVALALPPLEKIEDCIIDSYSDEKLSYQVSIKNMTCTCKDFKKRRVNFNANDPRRLCKHLLTVFEEKKIYDKQNELTKAMLDSLPNEPKLVIKTLASGNKIVLCFGNNEWFTVLTRRRKKGDREGLYTGLYERYGFNTIKSSWSYRSAPPGAKEIRKIISRLTY